MNRYSVIPVRDEFGRLIPGVLVYVYEWDFPSQSTGALSALYDDDGITPLLNPLTTDEFGATYFNTTGGMKLLEYHFAGRLYYREQIIVDPVGSEPLGLIPSKISRPGKYLAWDASGNAIVSIGTGADAGLRTDLAATNGIQLVNTSTTAISTTGTITSGSNNRLHSVSEAASADAVYWGRSYSGSKTSGAGVANLAYGPVGYMFDLRYDNAAAGTDYVRALYGRTVFGGSAATGGRVAVIGQAYQQLGITSASNAVRDYIGVTGQSVTDSGDGGTNTGAGALGAYFGMSGMVQLNAGAANVYEATAVEFNSYVKTGATVKYLFGATVVGFNEVRGVTCDAAFEIGGGTDAGFGPHVGWKTGILFSDIHGTVPVTSTSTLLGSYWTAGGTKALLNGIDLSGFAVSGALIQGAYASLSETGLSLGANGSSLSTITAGSGATNASLVLAAKGTGASYLQSGGGTNRVQADDSVGVRLVPKASATPATNGELAIEATSNTTLTFRLKGADGVVRSGTVTLA